MAHDASKVVLGTTKSNIKTVVNKKGTVGVGLAVFAKNDGTASATSTDGALVGISLGADLSNTDRCPHVVAGLDVPVQLTAAFTPVIGAQVHIVKATGKAGASDGANTIATNAVYASGKLTGVDPVAATTSDVALINMVGGL